jgi:hypothetical protein
MSTLPLAAAALATAALALGGGALAGRAGAALAAALFWLAPRHLELLFAARSELEAAWLPGARAGAAGPSGLRLAALTLPAAAAAVLAAGLLHTLWLAGAALRRRERPALRRELPLAAAALLLLAASGWRAAPGAVPAAAPALLLSILGARALLAGARALWPARARALAAALAAVALAPGLRAAVHAWPFGFASWGELAGGAPGAASRGLPRQAGGDASRGELASIGAHAVPGARIWWHGTARSAVEAWQRQGLLRPDLRWAEGPEDADLALWQPQGDGRDREYRIWSAFGGDRPVDAVFLDEVPLAVVYARPGAWR